MSKSLFFQKYQATGNDFVMIDNRELVYNNLDVKQICDRRFGIGADGLILLQNHPEYDFEMVYYNSDGNISTMCGNGGRCITKFAYDLGIIKSKTTFLAIDGLHEAKVDKDNIELKMIDVNSIEISNNSYILNTGSPHFISFVDNNLDQFDLVFESKKIRYNERFSKEGINVNFVEKIDINSIFVRTYERGVEDETYSCGTGVTACALSFILNENLENGFHQVKINTKGGNLLVKFENIDNKFENIWLCGNAKFVFKGTLEI